MWPTFKGPETRCMPVLLLCQPSVSLQATVAAHECPSLAVCAKPHSGISNATACTKTAFVLWFSGSYPAASYDAVTV